MKKGISQRKVQRMRNLATKNYGAKTVIQSGYEKKSIRHVEGDVWEEKGKTWTIKDGIKQSISKLSSARNLTRIPLSCPKCKTSMSASQHKYMYVRFKHCLFCQTSHEIEMINSGKYNDWKNSKISDNFDTWLKRSRDDFEAWLDSRRAKKQITEAGLVEDWSGGKTDEELRQVFENFIESEKDRLTQMIGE